jgi:hypothetical protein
MEMAVCVRIMTTTMVTTTKTMLMITTIAMIATNKYRVWRLLGRQPDPVR